MNRCVIALVLICASIFGYSRNVMAETFLDCSVEYISAHTHNTRGVIEPFYIVRLKNLATQTIITPDFTIYTHISGSEKLYAALVAAKLTRHAVLARFKSSNSSSLAPDSLIGVYIRDKIE